MNNKITFNGKDYNIVPSSELENWSEYLNLPLIYTDINITYFTHIKLKWLQEAIQDTSWRLPTFDDVVDLWDSMYECFGMEFQDKMSRDTFIKMAGFKRYGFLIAGELTYNDIVDHVWGVDDNNNPVILFPSHRVVIESDKMQWFSLPVRLIKKY